MKRIPKFLKEIFSPKDLHNLNVDEIVQALSDASVRKQWIYDTFEEIKRLNLEVDKRLLSESQYGLTDLAVRRKAIQDILEGILSARRQTQNPNPRNRSSGFDLDSVTVQAV